MQKKIFYTILTIFFCILNSCAKQVFNPYLVSHLPHIQFLEKQDHSFCSSLKINFDKREDLNSDLYWRCRLSLSKYRLSSDNLSQRASQHNLEITDLIAKISLKLADTPESILTRENKKMDERHHQQCLATGYEIATEDQAKIDDYFACRRALIDEQQLFPAFGNLDYLKHRNYSYDIGFVIDQRVDKDIAAFKEAKKEYPTCTRFDLHNVNFKQCTTAQDASRACFAKIPKQKFRKEWEEKIICQRKAYVRFPDAFLKVDEERKAQIQRMQRNANFYNNHSLESLGLTVAEFSAELEYKEEEEVKETGINNKNNLYDKFELTRLRRDYIYGCQKQADTRVQEYVKERKEHCTHLEEFEVIGEYTKGREI